MEPKPLSKPEPKSSTLREELELLRGQDPILDLLLKSGDEPTRENYVTLNWAGEAPAELDAEAEASLPAPFRKQPTPDSTPALQDITLPTKPRVLQDKKL